MPPKAPEKFVLATDVIATKTYLIRSQKIMIDRDIAEPYGIETAQLKRAVRRNRDRFPDDIMFALSKSELDDLRC